MPSTCTYPRGADLFVLRSLALGGEDEFDVTPCNKTLEGTYTAMLLSVTAPNDGLCKCRPRAAGNDFEIEQGGVSPKRLDLLKGHINGGLENVR